MRNASRGAERQIKLEFDLIRLLALRTRGLNWVRSEAFLNAVHIAFQIGVLYGSRSH